MEKRMELLPGVTLTAVQTEKFKTGCFSINFFRPLRREEAAMNALIPSVLLRGSEGCPDLRAIAARLDELYGASAGTLIRKKGEVQMTGFYADFIEDALAGEPVFAPMMDFLGKTNVEIRNVMILGASAVGEMVANGICRQVETVKVIDSDRRRCMELSENTDDNVLVVNGDGRNSDFLQEENIRDFDAFVAVTGNDEANILACVVAKKFGVGKTVAEVENIEYIRLAEEMGVDTVINKKLITAAKIFKMTLSNKVRFVKYMSGTDAEILEYIVAPDSLITRKPLKDTDFPKEAIIGGIIRGNESLIAVGDTLIEPYDRVVVFALPKAVKEVDRMFR